MADIDKFIRQTPHSQEDFYERDFVNKRSQLLHELMRKLSNECVLTCTKEKGSLTRMEFTENEEVCVQRCEKKVEKMQGVLERHLTDAFNPFFYLKYIS